MTLPVVVPAAGLPSTVTVYEVGARDGLQNETRPVPTEVKLDFIDRLAAVGLRAIEAAAFVRPDRIPQLADGEAVLDGLHRVDGVRYPVLVPNVKGLQRALDCGATDVAVFVSASETFSQRNLGCSVAQSLAMVQPVVALAQDRGIPVRGYVSMVCGDPWEGDVPVKQVLDAARALIDSGCGEISLGDTIGAGTPGQVTGLLDALVEAGIGVERLAVHFHDTYGQALANVLAALQAGVRTVDASAGGLGGCPFAKSSSGNLATEDLVWMLHGLGIPTGIDLPALARVSAWMAGELGRPSASRTVRALTAAPA